VQINHLLTTFSIISICYHMWDKSNSWARFNY